MDTEEYNETIDNIKKIEENVVKKGKNHWYDHTGKLIINGNNGASTKKKLIDIIKQNKKKYIDKNIMHVSVVFYYDQDLFLDKTMGPFEIQSVIYVVKEVLGKISLQLNDKSGSLVRIFYSLNEMKYFKIMHMKKIAILAGSGKLKTTLIKYYHYKDIKKLLDV